MKRSYDTRQLKALLSYAASMGEEHFTAGQAVDHFGNAIGRSTVYRLLEKLFRSGQLRKYLIDSAAGACYQYVADNQDCENHLHLKCESCDNLIHLKCGEIKEFTRHFEKEHAFKIDAMKTTLYGECERCQIKNNMEGTQ